MGEKCLFSTAALLNPPRRLHPQLNLRSELEPLDAKGRCRFGGCQIPRGVLLLRPGRDHAVAARVRDRLPQMLVLISEKQHHRALLR